MTAPHRVLVAAGRPKGLFGLFRDVQREGHFVVGATARNAAAAVEAALRTRPVLCLLDVEMPGGGIAAAWEIHARLPECAIVMLTDTADGDELLAALRAGAVGYLERDVDAERLPVILQRVLEGQVALPRSLMGRVVEELRDRNARRRTPLTQDGVPLTGREWQVLDLLTRGHTTAEIAEELVLSPVTVRTHIAALVRKFGAADRADLVSRYGER